MKFKSILRTTCMLLGALSLASCANYRAVGLVNLSTDFIERPANLKEFSIGCKILNLEECKKYLGRDLIKAGYQPLQLSLRNNSTKNYLFSLKRIDLPCARPEEVAEKVHTSTLARSGIYGTLGVLTSGLFLIPAVVDGVKSSKANAALDKDYIRKSRDSIVIGPHAQINTILFVPVDTYYDDFKLTLVDEETSEAKIIMVHAKQ